jgi:hypothetical protein
MRRSSNRPIVERLPHIAIKDIAKVNPRNNPNAVYCLDSFGLRYGGSKVSVSAYNLKIDHQQFRIKWIRAGFGRPRPLIVCSCGRALQLLYEYYGRWACRRCLKATYLSERISHSRQRLWKAAKLRLKNGGTPTESLKRPRYKHRKTYQRVQDQIHYLEMKARKARNKQFDVRLFAYHLI